MRAACFPTPFDAAGCEAFLGRDRCGERRLLRDPNTRVYDCPQPGRGSRLQESGGPRRRARDLHLYVKPTLSIAALLLLSAPGWGAAAPRLVARRPGATAAATSAAARCLTVWPEVVTLDGADSAQHLLVTGQAGSAAPQDLTPSALFHTSDPRVVRISAGIAKPVADGSAWIDVRAGGRSARVRVRVRNTRADRPVSFVRDVMPTLSKAGCYSSTCHAKQGGKNGFQLSVLAYDAAADYYAIARQAQSRRVNRQEPGASLLLTKATLSVPHGGGQRFTVGSPPYRLLARWIAEGARWDGDTAPALIQVEAMPAERVMRPTTRQQLLLTAVYADGSRRDVTGLAQYRSDETSIADVDEGGRIRTTDLAGEAAIMGRFMSEVAVARVTLPQREAVSPASYAPLPRFNYLDELVYRKLAKLNVLPSPLCDDATFLRRVSLDVTGTLPTSEETRRFLAECEVEHRAAGAPPSEVPEQPAALKARAALVERLLDSTEYADYWGMRWSDLLLVNRDLLLPRGAYAFDRWLRDAFRRNLPFDEFAREIVTASGETYRDGPPNFYRALPNPGDAARSVSQLFLGVRLDCAQCHHHPFERWGQDDFYSLAAFFARVKQKSSYPEGYHSIIYAGEDGEVKHPRTDRVMPPKPLGAPPIPIPDGTDRREVLARWMTAPENPYFARTIVNRMWGWLMGRGIVDAVDDFRLSNPASNEELLDAQARDLVRHGYDLKYLIRTITASAAYQRSCRTGPRDVRDRRNYSHYLKKRLPAEVLLDAVGQVTGVREKFRGYPEGTRAIQMWDSRLPVEFLETFGRPVRQSVCECERTSDGSVPQMLHLMNSGEIQDRLTQNSGTAATLAGAKMSEDAIITELYLRALSRYPRAEEVAAARTAFTREKTTRRQAVEDLLWALLNSAEFILNH